MASPNLEESLRIALGHHQAGRLEEAQKMYWEVLSQDGNCAFGWYLLGALLNQRGEASAGLEMIMRALELGFRTPELFNHLGECYRNIGQYDEAIKAYESALQMNPQQAEAMLNLGWLLNVLGRFNDALPILEKALKVRPDLIEARFQFGVALEGVNRLDEAIQQWETMLRLQGDHMLALSRLGLGLLHRGDVDRAITIFDKLVHQYPNYPEIQSNYAVALGFAGEFERAFAHAKRGVELAPHRAEAHKAASTVFVNAKRYSEALDAIDQAIKLAPDDRMARFTRSVTLLQLGRYLEGFKEHDWREPLLAFQWLVQQSKGKIWNPDEPLGRTILIHGEQGYGDLIQFARYVPMLAKRGVKVDLLVWHEIRSLMGSLNGVSLVESPNTIDFEDYELHFPLLSLPWVFKTTLETVPAEVPYLHSDQTYIQKWKPIIEAHARGLKVGIIWGGNKTPDPLRSCSMEYIARLADVPGVSWYSLQVGNHRSQLKDAPPDMELLDIGGKFGDFPETAALIAQGKIPGPVPSNRDFSDTAAVMTQMDLIITIDTSAAHLAGALGLKTWVMLPYAADWRWMSEGDSTPWYPTMRLFRQARPRDWGPVIDQIRDALVALVKSREGS